MCSIVTRYRLVQDGVLTAAYVLTLVLVYPDYHSFGMHKFTGNDITSISSLQSVFVLTGQKKKERKSQTKGMR